MSEQLPELWNTTEVARYLGIKATSVSAYRHRGHLPPPMATIGKQTHLWHADTIRAWEAARRAERRPDVARAMLLREAVATVDMDRDQTIDLGAPGGKMTENDLVTTGPVPLEEVGPQRNYAVATGEYIAEWLEEEQVSRAELEYGLGVSETYLNSLLAGQIALSDDVARALERLTGVPVTSWQRLDAKYWEDKARLELQDPARYAKVLEATEDPARGVHRDWEQPGE